MVEINGKKLCENCFEEMDGAFCTQCGYPSTGANDPTMLNPGSVLLGKYIVGKIMGKGGFGVTYLAYDVTANKKVAIKEFFPYGVALRATGTTTVSVASMDNAEAFKLGAEKFYNEAKLVAKFNGNPNIVGVYEFFYENDTVYFAMEYLHGHTLKEHIEEYGVLTAAQALFVAQNVANALMAAHSSNVLHRDISPDNIIICDNGDVKLIDFGAARQVVAEHSQSFSVILKPGFAPLEQYQKKGNQGPWTDIYSLGATIYYALTTDIPEDPMSRLDNDEEFRSNQYNVNQELWSVISKATELKIDDRYGDIFEFKNDLSKISIEAEPIVASNEQTADKMPEFQTAMPYGMTQTNASQPVKQPVGVGAPAPAFSPANTVNAQQLAPNGTGAPAKRPNPKLIAICGAAVAVVAAAIIIPIAVTSANKKPGTNPNYDTSTSLGTGSSIEDEVAEADRTAKSLYDTINDVLTDADADGCGMKGLSSYVDEIQIHVDSNETWWLYGINPDNFKSTDKYYWSSDLGIGKEDDAQSGNMTAKLLRNLRQKFPDMKDVSITAVLVGGQNCTFVMCYPYTEHGYDESGAVDIIDNSGNVASTYKWNGKTAGVTSSGLIVGTYPKVGLSGSSTTATETVTNQAYTTPEGYSITYTGEWSNNMPNGNGEGVYEGGNVYNGEWKDGRKDGQGKCSFVSGDVYEGEWKDDKINGQGKCTFASGNVYEGEWKDGKANGQGKHTWAAEGRVYEGEWKDNQRHGQGRQTWADGAVYVGEWKDDKLNGYGKYTDKNGKVQEGQWKDNKFVGETVTTVTNKKYGNGTYTGEWSNNMPNGQGKITYASGNVYEGEWKDGKFNGQGKYTWTDGYVYEGEWKDDKCNGKGKMTYSNGAVYEGEWKDDKFNGQGKYTYSNGDVYEGEWKDNKKNGQGKYTWANGSVREGVWKDDKFVG